MSVKLVKKTSKEISKKFYDMHRFQRIDESKAYNKTPKGRYNMYKSKAKSRDLVFNLTLEEFTSLIQKNCSYCGSSESIGVDRIDNEIGYTIENSTSCCTLCNMMKKNLPIELFINHCNKITSFNQ